MPSRQPSTSPNPSPSKTHFPIAPPIAAGAGICSILLIFFLFFKKFRWNRTRAAADVSKSNSPRRFSYSTLKKATLNFSESKRVGQGGFGSVYVGMLPGKKEVAVKLMDSGSLQGEMEFQNELIVAEKIDSEYVLKLLGFSSSRKHMVLVYEYMCNGSLQDALLLKKDARLKDWECRYLIALDVARGIEYLHNCDPSIVHCDVKPSNVLLDRGMRAKIGDFGLARFKEVEGKRVEDVVEVGGGVEDGEFVMEETESVTTMTTVGMDDFSVCLDQSPESVFKGVTSDEQSPVRNGSQGVVFPKICEGRESLECSTRGDDDMEDGKRMKEIVVQVDGDHVGQCDNSGTVKEYVMEWIGTEVKKERPKRGWIGDSSKNEVKAKAERKKKKKYSNWWVSLDEDTNSKKAKRRPAREWWKEEYSRDLMKKQKKNKSRQTNNIDYEYVDSWWSCNEGSNNCRRYSRSGSKRSRGSLDWWLDGLSGESWKGGHNSRDSCSGEFPKSGAMSSTPSMRGTVCYVAPEYGGVADNVNFSDKCDVYSYGVLLLVIIAGRRPLQVTGSPISEFKRANLVSWARHLARAGKLIELIDKSLQSVNQDQALCCIKVALLCIQKSPSCRPSIKEVVGMLSGVLSLPELPPELSPSRHLNTARKKVHEIILDCSGCLLGRCSGKIEMKMRWRCLCCLANEQTEIGTNTSDHAYPWDIYSLKELLHATNNFHEDNKIGEGGFGSVYWGRTSKGVEIAVKRLKAMSAKAEMEFAVEVEILGRVRHENLLGLRGFYAGGDERLIVYDYMPNHSLITHLHGQMSNDFLLDWPRRMNVIIGSAEGIAYLHHEANPHIIHRDIKASNVLLDSDFQAKVADFGFAKLIPDGVSHLTTRVKGTLGYLAPEYAMWGKVSESCDVYSFGILLLEIISARKPIEKLPGGLKRDIVQWVTPHFQNEAYDKIADPKLKGRFDRGQLKMVLAVAMRCVNGDPEKRPRMEEVVEWLNGGTLVRHRSKKELAAEVAEDVEEFGTGNTAGSTEFGFGSSKDVSNIK